MDWHKLQHTLFEMDPSDPREDLTKLQQVAQGSASAPAQPTIDYLKESVEVAEGSMPLGIDSVADFAALAGIRLDEKQKHGDYARGKDKMPKAEPGRTKHPLKDKLVGEADLDEVVPKWAKDAWQAGKDNYNKPSGMWAGGKAAMDGGSSSPAPAAKEKPASNTKDNTKAPADGKVNPVTWKKFLQQHTAQLQKIAADPAKKREFDKFMSSLGEADERKIKPRDPSAQTLNDLRSSGAMGAHKDKKKLAKQGYSKHKGKQYESIKDELWARLNELGKS
jgi:hypothetical protein